MVFSPDMDGDIMLGTAAPSRHTFDDELIGGPVDTGKPSDPQIINEDLSSLDDLLSQVVSRENELEAADQAE